MVEGSPQESFKILQPICVGITKQCDMSSLAVLQAAVNNLPDSHVQLLHEYIMFPLRLIAKQGSVNMEMMTTIYETKHKILARSTIMEQSIFQDMFRTVCYHLQPPTPKIPGLTSEEAKLAAVKCMGGIFSSLSTELLPSVYQPATLPLFGHAVSITLGLAEQEKHRGLRKAALDTVLSMMQHKRKDVPDAVLHSISSLFASFLPGMTQAFKRIVNGDEKQGHQIICKTIECWTFVVTLVMGDSFLPPDPSRKMPGDLPSCSAADQETFKPQEAGPLNETLAKLLVKKDEKWLGVTADRLSKLMSGFKHLSSHDMWKVRLAMVDWAQQLFHKCTRCHSYFAKTCISVLVVLNSDEYPEVQQASQKACRAIQEFPSIDLHEMLEENLHDMASSLPRLLRNQTDGSKLAKLRVLNGYLGLLHHGASHLVRSSVHLQRLADALMQAIQLDVAQGGLIVEQGPVGLQQLSDTSHCTSVRKHFKHFHEDKIYEEIVRTCHLLGQHGDVEVLIDYFTDEIMKSSLHRKEAILILNHIVAGFRQRTETKKLDNDLVLDLVRSLLSTYLSPDYFDTPVTNTVENKTTHSEGQGYNLEASWQIVASPGSINLAALSTNILQTTLLLEGVAVFSQVLGEKFRLVLMDVLCPVMEKVANSNINISQTALATLDVMATSCQYSNIPELLRCNADYVSSSLFIRLRHLHQYPASLQVLAVMLRHGDAQLLPLLHVVITQICGVLDENYEECGLILMSVLYTMMDRILVWFPVAKKEHLLELTASPHKPPTPAELGLVLDEYMKNKRIAAGDIRDEDLNDDPDRWAGLAENQGENCEEEEEAGRKKKVPYHVEKVKLVLEKCVHLLASENPRLRLVTLNTVDLGLMAISDHEDTLLPLVHLLWSPFIQRFTEKELLVVHKACKVLHTFALVAKDFIRTRLSKDVIPKLVNYLKKQSTVSLNVGSIYHQTLACKIQLQLLADAGFLCRLTDMRDKDINTVAMACLPYLSSRQPGYLQKAAIASFADLAALDPDLVWFITNEVCCGSDFQPPSDNFPNIKMAGAKTENEFSANIKEIQKYL